MIFSPQICAVNLEPLVSRERCTCGTKMAHGDNAHRQKKIDNPCCDSSRICDLQQIAFVSSHKFSPLLRIDGEGSLPFSQGKTSFKWRPSCACVATAALPSTSAHLSIRDVASWQLHHIDSTVCVTAVAEQVMSKSWQPMDTVFPRLHVS